MALHNIRCFIIFILTMLLLAACETDTSTPTPDPNSLSQSVTVNDPETGQLTVNYPASWFMNTIGDQINFGDSEQTLQEALSEPPTEPGAFQVNVLPVPNIGLVVLDSRLNSDSAPTEVLNYYAGALAANNEQNPGDNLALNNIEAFTAAGRSGAYVTGRGTVQGETADVALVLVKIENEGFVLFVIGAAEGEITPILNTIQRISGTLTYDATEIIETTESIGG